MKFWCSKIRINEKEVIKLVVTWEEDGVEKGWYKSSEKEDQKKNGKGFKKSNHVIGVLWGYPWNSPISILQVKHDNKQICCSDHDTHVKNISAVKMSGAETSPVCQNNTWMIGWNISVHVTAHARLDGIEIYSTTSKQCITSFTSLY